MQTPVEQIKDRLSITDVVSSYLKLEKAGSNLKARCPFHTEKTPSFFVSPARNSYYCFGCGAKGDIFTFVEQFEGLDFMGALRLLGERAGVPVHTENVKSRTERERLFALLEISTRFFEEVLSKTPDVLAYLRSRGLRDETIHAWRLGYAKESWGTLVNHLRRRGFSDDEIEKAGLAKRKDKGSDYYDRFRGRIMFPIYDSSGRPIAFSGRIFKDDDVSAKYVNSPETSLFVKSRVLYGYDRAKFSIRKHDFSIIVEGQMDLLLSHQAGFSNTVALSGTALTFEQVLALSRLSKKVVFALDPDSAGIASAGRGTEHALAASMDVKVARLPKDLDPAELIRMDPTEWRRVIRESKHIVEFYLDVLADAESDPRSYKLAVHRVVLPFVARIANRIDQAHFVSLIAVRLGVPEEAVWSEIEALPMPSADGSVKTDRPRGVFSENIESRRHYIERRLAGLILWQRGSFPPLIDPERLSSRLSEMVGEERFAYWMQAPKEHHEELMFEAELFFNATEELHKEVEDLFCNLEREVLRERFALALASLKQAEARHDAEAVDRAFATCQALSDELSELEKRDS